MNGSVDVSAVLVEGVPKRQFPRLPVRLPALLEVEGHVWVGATDKLSVRGCRAVFAADEHLPKPETEALIRLTFPSGISSEMEARVVSSATSLSHLAVALEFRAPDPRLRAFLRLHLCAHARHERGRPRYLA